VPFILVAILLQPWWAWRRLEAIVHLVEDKAADLQQFQPTERSNSSIKPSREVVLQYAKLLDHAVASARSELQFLSAIVDEMPDAVLIFDPQDRLLLCNRKIKQLIEAKHLEIGSPLLALAQRLQTPITTFSGASHSSGSTAVQNVFHFESLLGTRELLIKTTHLDSPAGGQLRLVILMDITELKQSQTQRDRALQFLSHDMRTPIASILSLTQRHTAHHSDTLQHDKITHHAVGLLQMMDDFILTVSSEAPSYSFKPELLDNLLNDAIEQVADLADAKNITVRDDSDSSTLFVMANTRLLVRALVNLLFNAVKFSPAGSKIAIQVSHTQAASGHAQQAIIMVRNPVHITPDLQDLIPSMPGFGLGLDFVDTVIHKHQGTITRNIPQNGMATIVITMPCTTS
jgi:signal transduction histidine kinase